MGKQVASWGAVVLVLVGGGFLVKATLLAPKPVEVKIFRLERGPVEETVTNSRAGTVKSRRDAWLSVETTGRVVELLKREGQSVQHGETLVKLEETEVLAALDLAEKRLTTATALVKEADAMREDARIELERNQGLDDVSAAVIDRLKKKLEAAEAQADASRARVSQEVASCEMARAQRQKVVLTAPFDGVIAERRIEVGEWAAPGKPVLRLINMNELYIRAELDEVDLAKVNANLPARAMLDPYRGRTFKGRVVRVAPYVSDVEAQNRTLEIEVELDEPVNGFKPGTSADVEVILQRQESVLRMPAYALLDGSRVLVAEDGVARARDVKVGLRNWEFVEITSGLAEGAAVIVTLDREEVKDGARIQVAP